MTARIASDRLAAVIDPLGAELVSLRDGDGRELMTDADPAHWAGHAPILFPIVGRVAGDVIRVDSNAYPMKQHGFARRRVFAVEDAGAAQVAFRLDADAETRAIYPFDFTLRLHFAIQGATLTIAAEIANREAGRALPASFGFHPAFAWPLPFGEPRESHRIVFSHEEAATIRRLEDGLIVPEGRKSPLEGRMLPLRDAVFAQDALIFDAVRSSSVRYGADTGPQLEVAFPDTPMLGVWTQPGAHFVCIEPWHGIADPVGYAGAFADKPGVFHVPPGESKRIAMSVRLTAG